MVVKRVIRTPVWGDPDPLHISTAHVERQNLSMRMGMRRFTRLTNGFSRKALNLQRALALYFMNYNFCRRASDAQDNPRHEGGPDRSDLDASRSRPAARSHGGRIGGVAESLSVWSLLVPSVERRKRFQGPER